MTNKWIRYKPIDPEIASLAKKHAQKPEAVLELFQELQDQYGGLTQDNISDVGRALGISSERAFGVASFYTMLSVSAPEETPEKKTTIRVCDGPVCWLHKASKVHQAAEAEYKDGWKVERSSCLGLCDRAPAALIDEQQVGPLLPEDIEKLRHGWLEQQIDYATPRPGEVRVMMAQAGKVDPDSIESALEHGAYCGLKKALLRPPEEVVAEVEISGLTGRGGAGFPVGRKWGFVARAESTPKYIICNADESEPLIFKDRVLIDTNPHQILEGMAIAGYATGANEAFIYIRGEYEHQAQRLERAIQQAEEQGWLGDNIQGSDHSFHIHVHRGAGSYICGEETALIESLEGKRGEPRFRPPYPPTYGYRGQPTLVNNVESYAAVPTIMCSGGNWYKTIGRQEGEEKNSTTAGTKLYMVLGHVNNPGLFEAPFGITLRQAIEDFGGGMQPGSEFQFALTGGAAGTIVPPSLLDVSIDYASSAEGVSLGAGAFLICDQSISVIAFLRELLHFFTAESCGKCTPCRVGTKQSLEILNRLTQEVGHEGDIEQLSLLADVMQVTSFCGLGQSVAVPVNSALMHFLPAFEAAEKRDARI